MADMQQTRADATKSPSANQRNLPGTWPPNIQTSPLPQTLECASEEQPRMRLSDEPAPVLDGEKHHGDLLFALADSPVLRSIISWCGDQRVAPEQTLLLLSLLKDMLLQYQRDRLTGLHARQAFLALAEQQLKAANRSMEPVLFFFADLDHLKSINDSLGHPEGDLALADAADILRRTFRGSDIIARIGGDEFVVLAMEAAENAEALRARLKKQLHAHNAKRQRPCELSMSVGTACYDPASPCSLDELLARADADMYREKRKKRARGSPSQIRRAST
ncbi:MAG: GGDEF domain-containing protein [Armatimonadetes bacterium]|nr:GGDEF domain-containing protein [Armatimonadota bacterium]